MRKNNLLIYRLGSLGDSIIALPAFHGIRKTFPDARITLLTNKPIATKAAPVETVLGKGYFFDDVLDYPVGTRHPFVLFKLIGKLRARSFDSVFNLAEYRSDKVTFRDWGFFRIAGIRHFYGFHLLPKDKTPRPDLVTGQVEWEASRIARRVEPVAKVNLDDSEFWNLRLTTDELHEADNLLSPIAMPHKVIAFSIGTKVQAKQWGIEKWTELLGLLSLQLPEWTAVLLGSSEEMKESAACLNVWSGPSLNLCGTCSPRVSAAILKRCKVFIGHDSGPMHLAACVGTPCVAIFSARNLPRQWFPRGSRNQIIYNKTNCAGCGLEECLVEKKKCLVGIGVEQVQRVVISMLNNLS